MAKPGAAQTIWCSKVWEVTEELGAKSCYDRKPIHYFLISVNIKLQPDDPNSNPHLGLKVGVA